MPIMNRLHHSLKPFKHILICKIKLNILKKHCDPLFKVYNHENRRERLQVVYTYLTMEDLCWIESFLFIRLSAIPIIAITPSR